MIKSIIVTNYRGDSIQLDLADPEKSGFLVKEISGLGPCKATINTTEVSTNDGSIYNSARLDARNIVLDLAFVGTDIETVRQLSYKYFPIKKELSLEIITDNRDCVTTGYVESNEPDIFSEEESASISIICPDAYFYSAKDGENITESYSETPMFEFPFCNDSLTEKLLVMGEIYQFTEVVVAYDGDAEVGATITLHAVGEVINPAIYNVETSEQMLIDTSKMETLTGSGFIAGDDIIICTVKGKKAVKLLRNGVYTNILNALDRNSDWFQLSKGENVLSYTAESGGSNLQIKIQNDVIYEGI